MRGPHRNHSATGFTKGHHGELATAAGYIESHRNRPRRIGSAGLGTGGPWSGRRWAASRLQREIQILHQRVGFARQDGGAAWPHA
jgi:hypothetical protein